MFGEFETFENYRKDYLMSETPALFKYDSKYWENS